MDFDRFNYPLRSTALLAIHRPTCMVMEDYAWLCRAAYDYVGLSSPL